MPAKPESKGGSRRIRSGFENIVRAGALVGALAGAPQATSEAFAQETTTTIEIPKREILAPRSAEEEAQYQRGLELLGSVASSESFEKILRPLLGGNPPGLLNQVSQRVAADLVLYILGDSRMASYFSGFIPLVNKAFKEDSRAGEILFKATKENGEWMRLEYAFKDAITERREWLPELLESSARTISFDEFKDVFFGGKNFADLPRQIQEILLPIVQKYYPNPDLTILNKKWTEVKKKEKYSNERTKTSHEFKKLFSDLYTEKQRVDFLEQLSANLSPEADDTDGSDLAGFIEKYDSWSSDPRGEKVLRTLLSHLARSGDFFTLYERKGVSQAYKDKPWAEEIDTALLVHVPSALYIYYENFKNYPSTEKRLLENASISPDAAISYYVKYKDTPRSLEVLKKAFPEASGALVLTRMERIRSSLSPEDQVSLESVIPKNIPFEVALLANNKDPNYRLLRKDPGLAGIEKVNRALLKPLLLHPATSEQYWKITEEWFLEQDGRKSLSLPTTEIKMNLMRSLATAWNTNPIELEETAAYIARNLHSRGIEISDTTVQAEVERIQNKRAEVSARSIFNGAIILVSHEELLMKGTKKAGGPRFGSPALSEALRTRQRTDSQSMNFRHITPLTQQRGETLVSSPLSLEVAKYATLDSIRYTEGPLTVFFDGHGGPDAFYFSDGQIIGDTDKNTPEITSKIESESIKQQIHQSARTRKITVDELVKALVERFNLQKTKNPHLKESDISFVFSACFMQNFTRSVAEKLRAHNIPAPNIMITASEFGQYSFSDFDNPFGSGFNQSIVESPNIGEIIKQDHRFQEGNPSIFVPIEPDSADLMQLSGDILPETNSFA